MFLNEQMKEDVFHYITFHYIIIIDGLDELIAWDSVVQDPIRTIARSIKTEEAIPMLFYSLIYCNLLYFCKVLVTSRRTEAINTSLLSTVIVALGFDEEAVNE